MNLHTHLLTLLLAAFFLCGNLPACALGTARRTGHNSGSYTESTLTGAKVHYSFDRYANNTKVSRTYISGEMLQAAGSTTVWKSSAWDISRVASRLTSLLSLHTHSVSTTKSVRQDMQKVMGMKAYEEYMNTESGNIKVVVFCHRGKGKTIDELIVFRFRSNYCSRVIQLTGKLTAADIAAIIHKSL